MFEYPIEKYQFYYGPNSVIAVSTYEGRKVRGVAKCDPRDVFDADAGRELAAARCNQKIAVKRHKRATRELNKAMEAYKKAERHMYTMNNYYEDSKVAILQADRQVENLLSKM